MTEMKQVAYLNEVGTNNSSGSKMPEARQTAPQPPYDKALHRYARQFYLQHYRVPRFGASQGDYALQAALSLAAGIYAATQVYTRIRSNDELGTLLAVGLGCILAWSTLHGINRIIDLRFEAKIFADKAILVAKSQDEVEQFFDTTYPHIFYHK